MVAFILTIIVIFVLYILIIIGTWNMYKKAGKPGWASIIPLYNIIVLLEISDIPYWTIVLLFIPYVNFVVGFILYIMITVSLCQSFGKSSVFCLGMFFLPSIFYPILGFDSSTYKNAKSNEIEVSIEKATDKIIKERLENDIAGLNSLNGDSKKVNTNDTYVPSATPIINTSSLFNTKNEKNEPVVVNKPAPEGLKVCKKCGTVAIIFSQKTCSNCGEEL